MNNNHGFTLLELLIALVLASIVLSLAIPAWKEFTQKTRAQLITLELENSIAYARLQAVINYTIILINPINNNYQNGWEVSEASTSKMLKKYPATSIIIKTSNFSHANQITIRPDGMTNGSNGRFIIGHYYSLIINRGGRVYIEKLKP